MTWKYKPDEVIPVSFVPNVITVAPKAITGDRTLVDLQHLGDVLEISFWKTQSESSVSLLLSDAPRFALLLLRSQSVGDALFGTDISGTICSVFCTLHGILNGDSDVELPFEKTLSVLMLSYEELQCDTDEHGGL